MDPAPLPTALHAVAALLLVVGLIFLVAWGVRRFGLGQATPIRGKRARGLKILETLLLDGRWRLVAVEDHGVRRTLLLGPGQATELTGPGHTLETLQPGESPTGLAHGLSLSAKSPAPPSLHAER